MKIKKPHGMAYVEKVPGNGWFLCSISVKEEWRGKGIGSQIMTEVLKRCGRPIYLFVTPELGGDLKRLKTFYGRFGFIPAKGKESNLVPYNYNMILEK